MAIVRRRYYIWLARAYIGRLRKTIITSLLAGIVIFFALFFVFDFYVLPSLQKKVESIGYAGIYTTKNLPQDVLNDVSYGLTTETDTGALKPGAAYRYKVDNNGKVYTFYIKKGQYFSNNKELNAQTLNYNFADAHKNIIDQYTVKYTLKDSYSPFLTTVSKPILDKNFSGLGQYKVSKIDINGGFVKSIVLTDKKSPQVKKKVYFYPNSESLKTAYALGEIDEAVGVMDDKIEKRDFNNWENTKVTKKTNYDNLMTIFFNNADPTLSDKKLRQALSIALPSKFDEGERAFSPIRPNTIYFAKSPNYGITDVSIAKSLIEDNKDIVKKTFEISVPEEYVPVAKKVQESWKKLGIKTKIKEVTSIPSDYQILIYPITLPEDPDQYTLWHSAQANNIVKYKNLRIDKLLEDGRSIADQERRKEIYADFQKYLIDDAPAAFLYFPYEYTISRK